MITATYVKRALSGKSSYLYKLSRSVPFETHGEKQETHYVVAHATVIGSKDEVSFYPADEDGQILSWMPLSTETGTRDHDAALKKVGWDPKGTPPSSAREDANECACGGTPEIAADKTTGSYVAPPQYVPESWVPEIEEILVRAKYSPDFAKQHAKILADQGYGPEEIEYRRKTRQLIQILAQETSAQVLSNSPMSADEAARERIPVIHEAAPRPIARERIVLKWHKSNKRGVELYADVVGTVKLEIQQAPGPRGGEGWYLVERVEDGEPSRPITSSEPIFRTMREAKAAAQEYVDEFEGTIQEPVAMVAAKEAGAYATVARNPEQVAAGQAIGPIKNVRDVYAVLKDKFSVESQEVFVVIPVDLHRVPKCNPVEIARGQRDQVVIDHTDVLRPVLATNAHGFIVAHCHPSTRANPSDADRALTDEIKKHAKTMKLVFIDHVVIGTTGKKGEYFSIVENKLYSA
jgi:DNA repair protein RadC